MRRALAIATLVLAPAIASTVLAEIPFQQVTVDPANPTNPHCKTLADVDGDGQLDGIVASSNGAGMYWYEYPDWTKHEIRASGSWTTDMQAGDIDGDGDVDIVIPDSSAIKWYEHPGPVGDPRTDNWTEHTIGAAGANNHDVELGDLEPDGDLDVVSRRKGGNGTYFWRQGATPTNWTQVTISTADGEGIGLGDIDDDGDVDVAQNRTWVEQVTPTTWTEHAIDGGAPHDVGVLVTDVDGNGTQDVVLGPSESSGQLVWYEAIDPEAGPWIEHSIDSSVSFLHTFRTADVDHDGDQDLVTAEMHQSSNPDEVGIYFNNNSGTSWTQQVVSEGGSHNVRAGDIGADGDIDIFGANWNDSAPNSAIVEMFENLASPLPVDQWRRHILETSLPWNAVFVEAHDLDGDGLPDLVAGGWWYPNPGFLSGVWNRQTIGAPLNNMAVVHDFDRDGDLDVLGTNGQPGGEDLSWAENDGSGGFTNRDITNTATGGDFLQGVSIYEILDGGQEEVVLSWHNGGSGTALLEVPEDPTDTAWALSVANAATNQEEVPTGDIDRDGDIDIHLGTSWLRQNANGTFTERPGITLSGGGVPDRVRLTDLDGDSDLDVVIGVEFADALVWGENNGNGGGWTEHAIASDFDYFSIDVADADGDGDIDVVGGAHMGSGEVTLYLNDGTGLTWTPQVIDSGDSSSIDHHDGTRFFDLDLDGDLDIVSVGWSKRSLVVYENLGIDGGGGGGDTTPPTLVSARAPGLATQVVVDFSEPLNAASASDPGAYQISGGVTVSDAVLAPNQQAVELTTSALTPAVEYVLTVNNVADLAGNPIAPDSTETFELAAEDPASGLVARWRFDEGAGSVAHDTSGNGHHGFLMNGTGWGAGPSGLFDGSNDLVDAGPLNVVGNAVTLAAWIYADNLSNCSSRDCRILSKATGTAEDDHYFMLSTISDGSDTRLRFRLKTDGSTSTLIASAGDLVENQWQHAAAVYDGVTMRLFLDGQAVGSISKTGSISQSGSVPAWIGGNPTEASSKPWDGRIDDVRIYDRALSAAELAALPPPSSDLIFEDGFEVGLTPWSRDRVGVTEVLPAAARIGTRGLRVNVGTTCASPDVLTVDPPPATVTGTFEGCSRVEVGAVEVVAPGATFRSGLQLTFAEGFAVSSEASLELEPALSPTSWIRDRSPVAEAAYTAVFQLDASNVTLEAGDRLEHLVARNDSDLEVFRIVLQSDGSGGVEALLEARLEGGSYAVTPAGQEAQISSGWHEIRVVWSSGDGDGSIALSIDGSEETALSALTNAPMRVSTVDWGSVGGVLGGFRGQLDLDGFVSWSE